MTAVKISYFDIDGGRAEPLRIALSGTEIDFTDHRISFPEFAELRQSARFDAVPVAEVDGITVTQSNALARFIGKRAGLYPADPLQALYCDEAMDAVEDITHYTVQTFGLKDEALAAARAKLVDGKLTTFLVGMAEVVDRGGDWIAGDQLSIADLKVFVWVRSLLSGNLEHVPTDLVQRVAPTLLAHQQRVADHPLVTGYYAQRAG